MTAHKPEHGTTSDRDHPTTTGRLVGVGGRAHSAVGGAVQPGVGDRVGERRSRLLVDLADAVRELVEPSTITEYVEVTQFEETVTRRGRRRKSKGRVRRAHHKRMPSLLDQLRYAEPPGTVDLGGATSRGEFESKPPAELATLSVLGEIVDGSVAWAKALGVAEHGGVDGRLPRLVSASYDGDTGLENLTMVTRQVRRWVRQAKNALRVEAPPITLGDPCPNCMRKNCLTVAGDLASARCGRCGREWSQDTIGLLANMLQANQQQFTLAAADDGEIESGRCWMADCIRIGHHDQHADHRGRTWGATCSLAWATRR